MIGVSERNVLFGKASMQGHLNFTQCVTWGSMIVMQIIHYHYPSISTSWWELLTRITLWSTHIEMEDPTCSSVAGICRYFVLSKVVCRMFISYVYIKKIPVRYPLSILNGMILLKKGWSSIATFVCSNIDLSFLEGSLIHSYRSMFLRNCSMYAWGSWLPPAD